MNDPRFQRAPRVLLVCDHLVRYAAGVGEGLRAQGANVALVTRDHAEDFGGDGQAMRDEVTARLGADAPVWWLPGRVRVRVVHRHREAAGAQPRRPQETRVVHDAVLRVHDVGSESAHG